MGKRLFFSFLLLVPWLSAAALVAQSPESAEPLPALAAGSLRATIQGQSVELPYTQTASGPLVALPPLVSRLGGELEAGIRGQGFTLRLADAEYLIGPDSAVIVFGQEILPLSQAPRLGDGGLQVPLDLLEKTFGEVLGFAFRWSPMARTLDVDRYLARDLPLTIDAVHLRGTTTIVLQFPERTRYRLVERPAGVDVELIGDRIDRTFGPQDFRDPLVEQIRVSRERVRLDLAPGAGAESYDLDDPFRIVLDIHPGAAEPPPSTAPTSRAPEIQRPPPRSAGRIRTIVLDPGHGGSESGALGKGGTVEKDLVLQLARALRWQLEARLGVRVVMTRSDDSALDLEARTAIANQNKADLFISIHLNSSLGTGAQGSETYFLSQEASDRAAEESAERENLAGVAADGGDPLQDLQLILWDLAQTGYMAESQKLGNLIQEELNGSLGIRDRGVKQAPFRVLMGAAMPAVLIEYGFLSNPEEEKKLSDPGYRAELVDATVRAISRYRTQIEGDAPRDDDEESP